MDYLALGGQQDSARHRLAAGGLVDLRAVDLLDHGAALTRVPNPRTPKF